jgi:MFS family permease
MCLLFCIANFIQTVHFILFAPIVNKILLAYPDASTDKINYMAMSFMICATVVNLIAANITEKFGLKTSLVYGCGLMLVGAILKSCIGKGFMYVLVGQTIIAVGTPFIYINAAKLSANWFPKEGRIYSTMFGMQSSILGCSLGFLLPSLFVPRTENIQLLRSSIESMLDYVWIF